jgi:hypothetical protein
MSKLFTAMVAAGICLGLNTAIANDSAAARNWSDFQGMVKKCNALTGTEKKQCMSDARDTYHASNFKCESMSAQDKTQCLKYGEEWKSAKANQANPAVTHDENPTMTPATPGDPTPSERNRDSTKQQQDAAGALPEPKN